MFEILGVDCTNNENIMKEKIIINSHGHDGYTICYQENPINNLQFTLKSDESKSQKHNESSSKFLPYLL